jgi:hypothetical protein
MAATGHIASPHSLRTVIFHDLGRRDYQETWDLQERHFAETVRRKFENRSRPAEDQLETEDHLFLWNIRPCTRSGKAATRIICFSMNPS